MDIKAISEYTSEISSLKRNICNLYVYYQGSFALLLPYRCAMFVIFIAVVLIMLIFFLFSFQVSEVFLLFRGEGDPFLPGFVITVEERRAL
jgi:hypothetical protein